MTWIKLVAAVTVAIAPPALAFAQPGEQATPPPIAIAGDPPPPETPRDKPVPRNASLIVGSALTARMPEGLGELRDLGRGGALSIGFLQRRGDVPTGFNLRGLFLGSADSRLYALDVQVIASAKLASRHAVAPFVGVGLAFGVVRIVEGDKATSGMALGPAAGLGLHGFAGDEIYWRADVSAIGAGAAVITAGLSLGWVFGT